MTRLGLPYDRLEGWLFALNVAIGTTIVWHTLRALNDANPIWAIASMIASSDPQPDEARRMFRCRLANVAVGGAWPGPPNDSTTFPQAMVVDYVRVYECSLDSATGHGCGTTDPSVTPL